MTADEARGKLLPVYFVADDSGSMEPVIGELNTGLTALLDAMALDAMGAAKIRFTVIGFSEDVQVHLDLADLRSVERMPQFESRNRTMYSAAFKDLRERIDSDVQQLIGDQYLVHRPAVFFLTDGEPTEGDQWRQPLAELKSPEWKRRPNIVAFGIGDARASTIAEVASKPEFAWVATGGGSDTAKALARFFEVFTQSLMNSAANPGILHIEKPEGFSMPVDIID